MCFDFVYLSLSDRSLLLLPVAYALFKRVLLLADRYVTLLHSQHLIISLR